MVACILVGSLWLDAGRSLLVLSMLLAAGVAGLIAVRRGAKFADIEAATGAKLGAVLPMLLILLAIGMLIGTWVLSGTIPYLLRLGLRLIQPSYLVPTAFLVTSLMSICTGTSWGSAGTIGVALMGTAQALDVSLAATAGAVVSGAYVGDKMSPLSDTTNICALAAGAPLMRHVRHMLYTALPSGLIALGIYVAFGQVDAADGGGQAARIIAELERLYRLDFLALLPLALVIIGIVRGFPPVLTMVASSLAAMLLGVLRQHMTLDAALISAVDGFQLSMLSGGTEGLAPALPRLLERGGMFSMTEPLIFIIAAFVLAGAMEVAGALDTLVHSMLSRARSVFSLVGATLASGTAMIAITSHAGVVALVVGELFRDAYRERGLAPENLSRSLEDSATIVEPILPWTVSAIFMSATLGVATLDYMPWAAFCYLGPLFSLGIAFAQRWTRFGIRRLD